jgi:hypothetical protein
VAELKPAPAGSILSKLRNVDWLGFFLFTGSLIGVLLGLTWVSLFLSSSLFLLLA